MPKQPLAEVFGFPTNNLTPQAQHSREQRLCPYNNHKDGKCTKSSKENPLGVCSVFDSRGKAVITCPSRFRQDWIMADDAAAFFFPSGTEWERLTEVRLTDSDGESAGNIDVVLISHNERGHILDYGALEVQSVYISGNVRMPFGHYMADPPSRHDMNWHGQPKYPRPDYLSSSRKMLAPQHVFKGGIIFASNNAYDRILIIDDISKEIKNYLIDMKVQSISN